MKKLGTQSSLLENTLRFVERLIPKPLYRLGQPRYHFFLAALAVLIYRFPSRHIKIIAITGTKGKTTTAEIINAILEKNGHKTALASTLRLKVGGLSEQNPYKMTLKGRFFVQQFLRKAVQAKCEYVIIEMTSESVAQFRHKFINFDALVFTNLSPEHIESHGSFEKYLEAKLKLRDALEHSSKKETVVVANADDEHGRDFLNVSKSQKIPFSTKDMSYTSAHGGLEITYKELVIQSKLEGEFNAMNILAAIKLTEHLIIPPENIKKGVESVSLIRGRVEHIHTKQKFDVIVDYAHTPDSLEKIYKTFKHKKKICVLGNTGGGRDTWKRPEMGRIAQEYCEEVVLTNEDPYDENPEKIVSDMKAGMKADAEPKIIIDRREAIHFALSTAQKSVGSDTLVIISGKGTDPYIMGARGRKIPWDDATVVREELEKLKTI